MTQTKRASIHDQDCLSVSCPMQRNLLVLIGWSLITQSTTTDYIERENKWTQGEERKWGKTETQALNSIVRKAVLFTILKRIPSPTLCCIWFNSLDLNICCLGESVICLGIEAFSEYRNLTIRMEQMKYYNVWSTKSHLLKSFFSSDLV